MNQLVLAVLAIIGWGVWGVCDKGAVQSMHPAVVAIVVSTMSIVFDVAILIGLGQPLRFTLPGAAWAIGGSLFSCMAFLAYTYMLRYGAEAGVANALTSGYPLVTMLVAALVWHEQITVQKLLGTLLIVAGIVVLNR